MKKVKYNAGTICDLIKEIYKCEELWYFLDDGCVIFPAKASEVEILNVD